MCLKCARTLQCSCSTMEVSLGQLTVTLEEILEREYERDDPEVFAEIGDDIKTVVAGLLGFLKQQDNQFFDHNTHTYDRDGLCLRCYHTEQYNMQHSISRCPAPRP